MKYAVLVLVALCMLAFVDAPATRAEESDALAPTPARTPADVEATMQQHGIPEVDLDTEARAAAERSVVGALTGLAEGRIGFMPLLQHHMGVEHWFVEGLTKTNLSPWPAQGERILVRLEGQVSLERLWSPFGGGTGFYGDGLPHGEVYGGPGGGVMGYHESVYRLVVDRVAWVRTKAEFAALGTEYRKRERKTAQAIERRQWEAALAAHREARALHVDLAIDEGMHSPADLEPALQALILLTGDASAWTDDDLEVMGQLFVTDLPSALGNQVSPALHAASKQWPPDARARLGQQLVGVWSTLEYRFQKDKLRKGALTIVGGPAVKALDAQIADHEAALDTLGGQLEAHIAAHEYAAAKQVWEQIAPHQAFLLTYKFAGQRSQHWLPSLDRAIALEAAWPDAAERMAVLTEQIRDAVAKGNDLANNSYRPRYPQELVEYFLPRLSEPEQRRIEALLIELAGALHPHKQWDGSLVAAELLTGVAGPSAAEFMTEFLAKRASINKWQRDYLEAYAKTIRERAP